MPKFNHDMAIGLIQEIDNIDIECADANYTDVGELWDMLFKLRDAINTTLPVSVRFPFRTEYMNDILNKE